MLENSIIIEQYKDESQMEEIMQVIKKDLSEPYSIYTYRYFIHNWLDLCLLVKKFIFYKLKEKKFCLGA